MKNTLYIALVAISTFLSLSVYAIPPSPPTPIKEAPSIIVCKDANALTEKEIADLNENSEKIISFDQEMREICFKK